MAISSGERALVYLIALASLFCCGGAQADSYTQSWAERLGLISYEPLQGFYEDYESAAASHLDDGPLQPFLPKSARNIYVTDSRFQDIAIAEYEFDKSDWPFFLEDWEELVDQSDTDHVLSVLKTCPWKSPLPGKGRYFRSVKQKRWDIRGYVIIEERSSQAWYYWSVPQPAKGSFCH